VVDIYLGCGLRAIIALHHRRKPFLPQDLSARSPPLMFSWWMASVIPSTKYDGARPRHHQMIIEYSEAGGTKMDKVTFINSVSPT